MVLLPADAATAELLPPGTLVVKPDMDDEVVLPSDDQMRLRWSTSDGATYLVSREEAERIYVLSRDLEACTKGFAECQADREKPVEPAPSRWGWIAGAVAGAFAVGMLAGIKADL